MPGQTTGPVQPGDKVVALPGHGAKNALPEAAEPTHGSQTLPQAPENDSLAAAGSEPGGAEEGEPQPQFMGLLRSFFEEHGREMIVPRFNKRTLAVHKLWNLVSREGGYEEVCRRKLWATVGRHFNPPKNMTNLSFHIKRLYERCLLPYEKYLAGEEVFFPGTPLATKRPATSEPVEEARPLSRFRTASPAPPPSAPPAAPAPPPLVAAPPPGVAPAPRGTAPASTRASAGGGRRRAVRSNRGQRSMPRLIEQEQSPSPPGAGAGTAPVPEVASPRNWVPGEAAGVEGRALVGFRVSVWDGGEAAFRRGRVVGYDGQYHVVQYEGGRRDRGVDLARETWTLCADDGSDAQAAQQLADLAAAAAGLISDGDGRLSSGGGAAKQLLAGVTEVLVAATTPRQGGPRPHHPDGAAEAAALGVEATGQAGAAWGGGPRAPAAPCASGATLSGTGSGAGAGQPSETARQLAAQASPRNGGSHHPELAASALLVQQAAQIIKGLNEELERVRGREEAAVAEAKSAREAAARAQLECHVAQATAAEAHRTLSMILWPQPAPGPGSGPGPGPGPAPSPRAGYAAARQTPPPQAPGGAAWPPALLPFPAGPQGRLTVAVPKPGERMDQF